MLNLIFKGIILQSIFILLSYILLKLSLKVFIILWSFIKIKYFFPYLISVIFIRELLIIFSTVTLNYNPVTDTFFIKPFWSPIRGYYKFNYSATKEDILLELKNSYIDRREDLLTFKIVDFYKNGVCLSCHSLTHIFIEPFYNAYYKVIYLEWYCLIYSLIRYLIQLTIIPFKLLLTWFYFIHILLRLTYYDTSELRSEVKLLKLDELIHSYSFFNLILPVNIKELICKDIKCWKTPINNWPIKPNFFYIIYIYLVSEIFILPYYIAFRRCENILFLWSKDRHMHNLRTESEDWFNPSLITKDSIPFSLESDIRFKRKKKTSKKIRFLLVLIYILCEHIWVIESFCSTFRNNLAMGVLDLDKGEDWGANTPQLYDNLEEGFNSISNALIGKFLSNSYFREWVTFYRKEFGKRADYNKYYLNYSLCKTKEDGLYAYRPIEIWVGRDIDPKDKEDVRIKYIYHFESYSHVKTIDYLSILFLER